MPDGRAGGRVARGWIPRQHGAWAMLILPVVAGAWLSGPRWSQLALGLFWIVGYLAYHALGRWLRARHRRRELPPVVVYGSSAAVLGIVTLGVEPQLVRWVPAYLPLLAVSLWLTAHGRERSLTNDVVTVLAACLMAAVTYDAGGGRAWASLWMVTAVLTAYFLGTVLYVKTMIRERGRPGYVQASVGYHLAVVVAAVGLVALGWASRWLVAIAVALVVRAALGPAANARRRRPLRPVVVGVGEIVAALLVTVAVLAGASAGVLA
ncbi:MAG: YwiC-like family protein [Actinomycetota bacterium]